MTKLKRDNRCKHFTGLMNTTCKAGVAYQNVKDSSATPYRWPCFSGGENLACDKREYPTPEELDAEEEYIMSRVRNIVAVRKAIVAHTQGKRGTAGDIDCPICKDGKLAFSVAGYNGHIWAKCSTPKCVEWIE